MDIKEQFLKVLNASLKDETISCDDISLNEWEGILCLALQQHVLPIIYERAYKYLGEQSESIFLQTYRQKALNQVAIQTVKTEAFLELYKKIQEEDINPLIMKGLVCRSLYPQPDYRPSSDEDILILPSQLEKIHGILLNEKLELMESDGDIYVEHEVPYVRKKDFLFVEVHNCPFPKQSEAYSDYNRFFKGVHERAIKQIIAGVSIYTMEYTDHLLFLICHAFKHFIHSGFGVRQVCDMVLFANAYGNKIEWSRIVNCCREINAERFVVAIFKIGQNKLGFDIDKACYPKEWSSLDVDETMLLNDMFDGGVLGNIGMDRIHSSSITLNAVSEQKRQKGSSQILLKTIFPSIKIMVIRYKYLKKYPILLPIAWGTRIIKYGIEIFNYQNSGPAKSLAIGRQRIKLLKEYGILK